MQSLFISLVITFLIYFNFFSFSLAQDLYDVDEAFFKRNGRFFEVKKDSSKENQSIRETRKSPPPKGNNKDSPYADEHFNFDTLAGIGLGKRSSPISRFGQARNSLQNHYGKLFFRSSGGTSPSQMEKRFLNHSDLDRAIGNRVIGSKNYGKKKTTFPFLWLN